MTRRVYQPTKNKDGIRVNSERDDLPTADERELLYEAMQDLYERGYSDLQIAERVGVCDRTVRRWRFREGKKNIYGRMPTYGG